MKKNSFTEIFYKNAGYIVVVLISVVYVASSLINISRSGKSVYEIIGAGVLSLIVGILINGIFRSIGLRRGDEDERSVATHALHAKTVDEITPYIDRLDEFCEIENKRALKTVRTRILAREGLKYGDYFDEDGNVINAQCGIVTSSTAKRSPFPHWGRLKNAKSTQGVALSEANGSLGGTNCSKILHSVQNDNSNVLDKAKRRAYRRALKVKIKPLMPSNLTSDGVKADDPFDFGRSKKEYASVRNASDIIIKILMAVIFGYFGVSLASDINGAALIWNSLQIVLYITGGIIQMYSSYSWVVDDYRGGVIRKIDMLQKFKLYSNQGTNNVEK